MRNSAQINLKSSIPVPSNIKITFFNRII
jgi:hypothetical protein